jgi:hypothetical protein
MPQQHKTLLTQRVLEEGKIHAIGCLRCGLHAGQGPRLYPFPLVEGTLWCPNCSPPWLQSFLDFATANQQRDITSTPPESG